MAAENSNKLKLKTCTSTRKNTLTLVTLQSWKIERFTNKRLLYSKFLNNLTNLWNVFLTGETKYFKKSDIKTDPLCIWPGRLWRGRIPISLVYNPNTALKFAKGISFAFIKYKAKTSLSRCLSNHFDLPWIALLIFEYAKRISKQNICFIEVLMELCRVYWTRPKNHYFLTFPIFLWTPCL